MAPNPSSDEVVYSYDKAAKEKVRKRGDTAKQRAVKLGKDVKVFSATVHFNPTYEQLDGAIYVPKGQKIPDVNRFLLDLYNGLQPINRRRRSRRSTRHRRRDSSPVLDEITVETSDSEAVRDKDKDNAVHQREVLEDAQHDLDFDQEGSEIVEPPEDTSPDSDNDGDDDDDDDDDNGNEEDDKEDYEQEKNDNIPANAQSCPVVDVVAEPETMDGLVTDTSNPAEVDMDDAEAQQPTLRENSTDWSKLLLPDGELADIAGLEEEDSPVMPSWLFENVGDEQSNLTLSSPRPEAVPDAGEHAGAEDANRIKLFKHIAITFWQARQAKEAKEAKQSSEGGREAKNNSLRKELSSPKSSTGRRDHVSRLDSSPTTVSDKVSDNTRGVDARIQQRSRFFKALALRFHLQSQARALEAEGGNYPHWR